MQLAQRLRSTVSGLGRVLGFTGRSLWRGARRLGWRDGARVLVALVAAVVVYYVAGSIWLSKVDADLSFAQPTSSAQGESRAVAVAAALIDREVNRHGWTPNDPFYKPTFLLDNMPNFQKGVMLALARFGTELQDQLGRSRGSSPIDPDLEKASGRLRYSTDRWIWNPGERWWALNVTSEYSYNEARKALIAYNSRLASGEATFDRRADNLRSTLDRIALDLGSASASIDEFVAAESGFPWNWQVDDLFYRNKGQIYANYLLLRELKTDFAAVLGERKVDTVYQSMLESLEAAVSLQPAVILNGSPASQFFPNHVVAQGFYLMRARTQLREITSILET